MGVPPVTDQGPTADRAVAASPRFVLVAAAIVGFAFFLMELVWYRMLGPILGGTVYTFGLVLAVALAGIALGGLAYPFVVGRRGPSLTAFALTCLAEAACLAVPYAIGDRLALLALRLRPGPGAGLWGHVEGWTVVTGIVVLPAAAGAAIVSPATSGSPTSGTRSGGSRAPSPAASACSLFSPHPDAGVRPR